MVLLVCAKRTRGGRLLPLPDSVWKSTARVQLLTSCVSAKKPNCVTTNNPLNGQRVSERCMM